jgi:hypothetical protein
MEGSSLMKISNQPLKVGASSCNVIKFLFFLILYLKKIHFFSFKLMLKINLKNKKIISIYFK